MKEENGACGVASLVGGRLAGFRAASSEKIETNASNTRRPADSNHMPTEFMFCPSPNFSCPSTGLITDSGVS